MARAGARMHNPAGHAGLIDNAIGLISALFAYVETRAALLAVESKAMLLQLAAVIAFALAALIALDSATSTFMCSTCAMWIRQSRSSMTGS